MRPLTDHELELLARAVADYLDWQHRRREWREAQRIERMKRRKRKREREAEQ